MELVKWELLPSLEGVDAAVLSTYCTFHSLLRNYTTPSAYVHIANDGRCPSTSNGAKLHHLIPIRVRSTGRDPSASIRAEGSNHAVQRMMCGLPEAWRADAIAGRRATPLWHFLNRILSLSQMPYVTEILPRGSLSPTRALGLSFDTQDGGFRGEGWWEARRDGTAWSKRHRGELRIAGDTSTSRMR